MDDAKVLAIAWDLVYSFLKIPHIAGVGLREVRCTVTSSRPEVYESCTGTKPPSTGIQRFSESQADDSIASQNRFLYSNECSHVCFIAANFNFRSLSLPDSILETFTD